MPTYTNLQKSLAMSVHLFTASGMIAGLLSIIAISAHDWKTAMLWLWVSMLIDGVDGTFARLFKVKEVLPNFNGTVIDYVIDFANYAIIPAYFCYEAKIVGEQWSLLAASLILLTSAIYYGKDGMVSGDMCFVGFPVMWNMVVFYQVFVFDFFPEWLHFILIIILCVLHFIPIKFVYPSRATHHQWLTLGVSAIFIASNICIMYQFPIKNALLLGLSIGSVAYYMAMAIYDTWWHK